MDFEELEPREIELAAIDPEPIKTGVSWAAIGGGLASLVWLGAAIGAPISFYGVEGLARLNPSLQAGFVALAFGPAILFWLASSAVGEAAKARKLAVELTRIVRDTHAAQTPALQYAPVNNNTNTMGASLAVKVEIESLNDAVSSAVARLNELDDAAQRNVVLFSQALAQSRDSAADFLCDLSRERDALVAVNDDIKSQTETMTHTIGRQVRLMREASKLVATEMVAAEDVFEKHIGYFGDAAVVMAQRTAAFHDAAEQAQSVAQNLDVTMGSVLDGLSEATHLTEAARKSAEDATVAANQTATAVRDATQRAVIEARRAAQMVRAETAALTQAADETLQRLGEAAKAARAASEDSQAAADRHAASIEKRLAALAATAAHKRAEPVAERVVEREVERPIARVANEAFAETAVYAAAETKSRVNERRAASPSPIFSGMKGPSDWSNFMPADVIEPANSREDLDAFDFTEFGTPETDPDDILKRDALELVAASGVDLAATLDAIALEAIAHRSRFGATARRRAVAEAAPVAVSRITRHIKRNAGAKVVAGDFRGRPDLAKAEKKGSDVVRAYLLIDAALA